MAHPAESSLLAADPPLIRRPRETLRCEELHLLVRAGWQQHRSLRVLAHDYALIQRGVQLVFAIDFSELYTFLWPRQSHASNQYIARKLLESSELTFTLLPGTVFEFVRHLYRRTPLHTQYARRIRNHLESIDLSASIHAFVTGRSIDDMDIGSIVDEMHELQRALSEISELHDFYGRLTLVNEAQNIIPFKEVLAPSGQATVPDVSIFGQCNTRLESLRPAYMDINNFIDAHNYSLAWSLSHALAVGPDPTICLLATSSTIPYRVFRDLHWDGFRLPSFDPDPNAPQLSLARHTIHAYYLDRMLAVRQDRQQELLELMEHLKIVLQYWNRVDAYQRYRRREIPPSSEVELPADRQYLRAYVRYIDAYNELFDGVRSALEIDMISDENVRRAKDVELGAVGARSGLFSTVRTGDDSSAEQSTHTLSMSSPRMVFSLLDDVTRLTLQEVSALKDSVAGVPDETMAAVDVFGVLSKGHRLRVDYKANATFGCTEVTARYHNQDKSYLHGDIYDAYYAIWWEPRVSFHEFMECVKQYITQSRRSGRRFSEYYQNRPEKHFDGVLLFPESGKGPVHVAHSEVQDYDADTILEWAEGQLIRSVRIATSIADFCYDFRPTGAIPRRAGIISDLPAKKPLVTLVQLSNRSDVSLRETKRVVSAIMRRYVKQRQESESAPSIS